MATTGAPAVAPPTGAATPNPGAAFAASINNALAQALGAADLAPTPVAGADRLVNETCLELLNAELVELWAGRAGSTDTAFAKIEAVGFQVGQRLAERYALALLPRACQPSAHAPPPPK